MSRMYRAVAILFTAVLTLIAASPTLAADPIRRDSTTPQGSLEPAGVATCDVRLSLVDGPLVDSDFSVRVYEPFIVSGFGYPPSADVTIEFADSFGSDLFDTTTDSAGEFGLGFYNAPGSEGDWLVSAYPTTLECQDSIQMAVLAPYPFTDVDGFEFEIAWLYREGITGGCTATRFCPTNPVTRGQMAAFLSRALGLPGTGTDFFDDDDGTTFEGDINRLAAAGITGGCATRRYCPNAKVTRDQMASFLTRAFALPPSGADFFTDDEANIHEGSINAMAAAGITGGCAVNRYCPSANVTREQMAAFLYRGFN